MAEPALDLPVEPTDDPSPTPPAPPESAADAVDRAFAEVEAAENPAHISGTPGKVEAPTDVREPAKTPAPVSDRNPDGTFKAKEVDPATPVDPAKEPAKPLANFTEAPPRFSSDAKAAWKDAPEPVRAEIHRAVTEMETGIERYRTEAEAFAPLKEYDTLAKQHGTSINEALDRYTALEKGLASPNPTESIREVLRYANLSAVDFAKGVLQAAGMSVGPSDPNNPAPANDRQGQIMEQLYNKIDQLEHQIGSMGASVQEQQNNVAMSAIAEFAVDHPRLDELSGEIVSMLKTGFAQDLPEAYEKAARLNPLPTPPVPDPEAQNLKGQLSISGAPSSGSDPTNKKVPSSPKEAVDQSFDVIFGR